MTAQEYRTIADRAETVITHLDSLNVRWMPEKHIREINHIRETIRGIITVEWLALADTEKDKHTAYVKNLHKQFAPTNRGSFGDNYTGD